MSSCPIEFRVLNTKGSTDNMWLVEFGMPLLAAAVMLIGLVVATWEMASMGLCGNGPTVKTTGSYALVFAFVFYLVGAVSELVDAAAAVRFTDDKPEDWYNHLFVVVNSVEFFAFSLLAATVPSLWCKAVAASALKAGRLGTPGSRLPLGAASALPPLVPLIFGSLFVWERLHNVAYRCAFEAWGGAELCAERPKCAEQLPNASKLRASCTSIQSEEGCGACKAVGTGCEWVAAATEEDVLLLNFQLAAVAAFCVSALAVAFSTTAMLPPNASDHAKVLEVLRVRNSAALLAFLSFGYMLQIPVSAISAPMNAGQFHSHGAAWFNLFDVTLAIAALCILDFAHVAVVRERKFPAVPSAPRRCFCGQCLTEADYYGEPDASGEGQALTEVGLDEEDEGEEGGLVGYRADRGTGVGGPIRSLRPTSSYADAPPAYTP